MTNLNEFTPYEAKELLSTKSSVIFIDVRSEMEYNDSHIVGSINVPYSTENYSNIIKKLVPGNKSIILFLDKMRAFGDISGKFTNLGHDVLGYLNWSNWDKDQFPKETLTELTPESLDKLLNMNKNPIIIDVRNPDEWALEHIPNTINIPLHELENKINEFQKETEIVTVCGVGGGRSSAAYSLLKRHGFNQTKLLKGGVRSWKNKKLSIESQ